MTRFTVVWVQDAQDELTELWLNAPDRNVVTNAANIVEQSLSQNPSAAGSELSEGLRSLIAPPIKVIFTVREDDRIAEVLRVRHI